MNLVGKSLRKTEIDNDPQNTMRMIDGLVKRSIVKTVIEQCRAQGKLDAENNKIYETGLTNVLNKHPRKKRNGMDNQRTNGSNRYMGNIMDTKKNMHKEYHSKEQ